MLNEAKILRPRPRPRPWSWGRGQDRGQGLEAKAEAEAKALRPRPRPRPKFWPRGHFGLEDLTSLDISTQIIYNCHAEKSRTRPHIEYDRWINVSGSAFWQLFHQTGIYTMCDKTETKMKAKGSAGAVIADRIAYNVGYTDGFAYKFTRGWYK